MFKQLILVTVALGFSGLTNAQLSLSQQCTDAITSLIATPASTCLDVLDLSSVANTPANSSVVPSLNTWATGVCSASSCSNSTLNSTVFTVLNGCSTDLAAAGVTDLNTADVVSIVEQYYPLARELLCLESGNTLCLTSTLNAIQSSLGQSLTITKLESPTFDESLESLPASVLCTPCTQSVFSLLTQNAPQLDIPSVEQAVVSVCGSSFTTSGAASGVTEVATASATANSAVGLGVLAGQQGALYGVLGSVFVGLLSLFVVVA